MIFREPLFLYLIPVAILLCFIAFRVKGSARALPLPSSAAATRAMNSRGWGIWVLPFLRALALSLLLIALARPQTESSQSRRLSQGIDIMIAFDVSKSMLIEDFDGQNRIDTAKVKVREFVRNRSDDRIGFLMFSGEAITLCPPTLDYQVLDSAIEAATTDQLKDGTAIGDAIASAVNRIKDSTAKSRIIILITDGDNNMGSVAPLTAGSLAKGFGIKVYSIALGREGTVDMPIYVTVFGQQRKQMQRVNSTINPELLKKISAETGGKFFRAQEEDSLEKVLSEIDQLEKSKVETKTRTRQHEHYYYPLSLALIFIFLEFALARTRLRILPG